MARNTQALVAMGKCQSDANTAPNQPSIPSLAKNEHGPLQLASINSAIHTSPATQSPPTICLRRSRSTLSSAAERCTVETPGQGSMDVLSV